MDSSVELAPAEVSRRLRAGEEIYFLDVRPRDVYERWHIDGSHNLPVYDQLEAGDIEPIERRIDEFPDGRTIVVVCNTGNKSALPANILREHGYVAHSMDGGMHGWGSVYEDYEVPIDGVTQIVRPGTGCLSYLVRDGDEALVVDPGMHTEVYGDLLDEGNLSLAGVADTHAHADHISGAPALAAEFDVPYYAPGSDVRGREDCLPVDQMDELSVGEVRLEVVRTPGHTSGSVCFLVNGALLSGDTLFVDSVGRPDLEAGREAARHGARRLFDSLEHIGELPGDTLVLPGHFSTEAMRPVASPLEEVRSGNDLLGAMDRDTFVETLLADLPQPPANYDRIKAINTGESAPDGDVSTLELGPNNCACN